MQEATVPAILRAALDELVAEACGAGGELALDIRHLERGERYQRGEDVPFSAASTIKLPILVALYGEAARGRIQLDEPARLRAEDQVTGSGVLQLLSPGIRLPWRDVAELMIAVSDNAATNLILARLGLERVNACLQSLGLRRTAVGGPLQVIPAEPVPRTNTVTAGDLAELLQRVARGTAISWEACRRMVATLKRQRFNDALPALLPPPLPHDAPLGAFPAWELAHKTGGIIGHEHDVGILYLPGQSIVICALSRHGGDARWARGLIARVGRAVWEGYAAPLS